MGFKWNPPKSLLRLGAFGSFVGGIVLLKEVMAGANYQGKESLEGKVVIVTGANTGIGKESAQEFARRGARVIMACRNVEKCIQARKSIVADTLNRNIVCRECDLASFESVKNFAARINKSEDKIHVLVNNAGVMRCNKTLTKDGIELQFSTNHLGPFLLTNLLLDKIKASAPSRIINVSSIAHQRGSINFEDLNSDKHYDDGAAYNQSKLANILFTNELAERLKGTEVTCNAVHPGLVNTEIMRHLSFYKSWLSMIFIHPITWFFLKTPRQGAQTTIYAALNPELEGVTGKYFANQKEAEPSAQSKDQTAAKHLWAISEHWTGLS